MNNININKMAKQTYNNISKQSTYENTKAVYKGYVKKMGKSDFANSISRYEVELNMLKSMKQMAEQSKDTKELKYIDERISNANDKLAQLGIKIKE